MTQVKYTAEQIIGKLRESEVLLTQGMVTEQLCRKLGIHSQTYYHWRKEYGGMNVEQAKRLKELEQENGRLKRLVADLSLDNQILKELSRGNYQAPHTGAGRLRRSALK